MNMSRGIVAVVVIGSLAGVYGCRREGPAERAGREVDRAVERVGIELGKAGDRMGEVVKKLDR